MKCIFKAGCDVAYKYRMMRDAFPACSIAKIRGAAANRFTKHESLAETRQSATMYTRPKYCNNNMQNVQPQGLLLLRQARHAPLDVVT